MTTLNGMEIFYFPTNVEYQVSPADVMKHNHVRQLDQPPRIQLLEGEPFFLSSFSRNPIWNWTRAWSTSN